MQKKIEDLIKRREQLLDTRPPACLRKANVSKERRRAYNKMMDDQIEKINVQIKSLRERINNG
tara:strand:- start:248 stop:436 length:189 start_codon:yes stop_codon:yes gene_type:complete